MMTTMEVVAIMMITMIIAIMMTTMEVMIAGFSLYLN